MVILWGKGLKGSVVRFISSTTKRVNVYNEKNFRYYISLWNWLINILHNQYMHTCINLWDDTKFSKNRRENVVVYNLLPHPTFRIRQVGSRWVNLCSSWTHAWTLNSCTIVSGEPCYKRGRRRRERRVSSHCSRGPGHGTEIRDKRHEKRRTYAAPVSSLLFPFLPSIRARSAEEEAAVLSTGSIFRTRTRVSVASWSQHRRATLVITNGRNESLLRPAADGLILGTRGYT